MLVNLESTLSSYQVLSHFLQHTYLNDTKIIKEADKATNEIRFPNM